MPNKSPNPFIMIDPTNCHSFEPITTSIPTNSQPTISLASYNIISFTDYTKCLQIINEYLSNNIDILGLSETNLTFK